MFVNLKRAYSIEPCPVVSLYLTVSPIFFGGFIVNTPVYICVLHYILL